MKNTVPKISLKITLYLLTESFCFLSVAGLAQPTASGAPIQVTYGKFAGDDTIRLIQSELSRPTLTGLRPTTLVTRIPMGQAGTLNPLGVIPADFNAGMYLAGPGEPVGEIPSIPESDASWFSKMVQSNKSPDVFVIGGHQVISEGWHNHVETQFMFLPTLLKTIETHPDARAFFDNVKVAILGGCNTMTNLEPHKESTEFDSLVPSIAAKKIGAYLTSEEIKAIYDSGPRGKNFVIGKSNSGGIPRWNSLEFYRARLAREYGLNNPEHYEYTRGPQFEKCLGPGKYENCKVTNVDRIFPDYGLWDNTHRYNYPLTMKKLFRNSSLVIGWSSASPNDDQRAAIIQMVLTRVRADANKIFASDSNPLNRTRRLDNVFYTLMDAGTEPSLKTFIIQTIRKYWTQTTASQVYGWPSGSITPATPELDADGIFTVQMNLTSLYAPYRESAPQEPNGASPMGAGPLVLQLQ